MKEIKYSDDMDKDILEKIKQSQDAYSESSALRSKAWSLEYDALCDIFRSRGIIFGKTIVKNKETGRRGILRTTSDGGYSATATATATATAFKKYLFSRRKQRNETFNRYL